jgi:hypothetical protein
VKARRLPQQLFPHLPCHALGGRIGVENLFRGRLKKEETLGALPKQKRLHRLVCFLIHRLSFSTRALSFSNPKNCWRGTRQQSAFLVNEILANPATCACKTL